MGLEGLGISESTEKRRLSTHRFACNPVCNPNAKIYAIMGKNLLYKARNKDYEKKNTGNNLELNNGIINRSLWQAGNHSYHRIRHCYC